MHLLFSVLLAAQPAPPPPVAIRPGESPQGVTRVPPSETAEPIGLAIAGFDADGDGLTSRAEFDAALERTFGAADRSSDGTLGYIEYSGWAATWLGSATALPGPFAIDADGDNQLARGEFVATFANAFGRLDANRDGSISRAELLTVSNPRLAPVLDRDGRAVRQRRRRDGD
jgi:hypothetical protein